MSLLSSNKSTEGLRATVVPIKPVPAFTIRPTCRVPLNEFYVKSNDAKRRDSSHWETQTLTVRCAWKLFRELPSAGSQLPQYTLPPMWRIQLPSARELESLHVNKGRGSLRYKVRLKRKLQINVCNVPAVRKYVYIFPVQRTFVKHVLLQRTLNKNVLLL